MTTAIIDTKLLDALFFLISFDENLHCLVSNREGLGTSL